MTFFPSSLEKTFFNLGSNAKKEKKNIHVWTNKIQDFCPPVFINDKMSPELIFFLLEFFICFTDYFLKHLFIEISQK